MSLTPPLCGGAEQRALRRIAGFRERASRHLCTRVYDARRGGSLFFGRERCRYGKIAASCFIRLAFIPYTCRTRTQSADGSVRRGQTPRDSKLSLAVAGCATNILLALASEHRWRRASRTTLARVGQNKQERETRVHFATSLMYYAGENYELQIVSAIQESQQREWSGEYMYTYAQLHTSARVSCGVVPLSYRAINAP